MKTPMAQPSTRLLALSAFLVIATTAAAHGQWTHWRGPQQTGVVLGAKTVASWSVNGDNLLWRDDFVGRSTPVVVDGRVCAIGRVGEDKLRQEIVACWNAESGQRLWERRYTVHQTDVPWNRVGWANLAADTETGYVIANTVDGLLTALDRDGRTVWQWSTGETFGRLSGYGGRTQTPIVDENRVIIGIINSGWGPMTPPRHRYLALDKKSGEVLWISNVAGPPAGDLNTESTPVIAVIGGRRLMIGGNTDGWVHAIDARSGQSVWKFHLSKRGLNASVAVDGNTVFASHSEENIDEGTQGRLVAIDATGSGDVTASHEKWRFGPAGFGFPSPLVHDGRLYLADNSANLHAFDAATGKQLWVYDYGTVGKSSPAWADGKLYLTEVNGRVAIIEPSAEGVKELDREHVTMPSGRHAEIYGSPAIAYDRVYFTTEEGIYCLGDRTRPFRKTAVLPNLAPTTVAGTPTLLEVVPAEVAAWSGTSVHYHVRAFDAQGREVSPPSHVTWSLKGPIGTMAADGEAHFEVPTSVRVGGVSATAGELTAHARVLVAGPLPWSEDFEHVAVGKRPRHWQPGFKGANVQEIEGNKVLMQPKAARGAPRGFYYIGPADMSSYTIQADILGGKKGRRYTDVGLINSGYYLDVQGAHQRVQVRSWGARRMAEQVPFAWEMGVWYTAKLRVDIETEGGSEQAVIRGKVWKRGDSEPAGWTITVRDPIPIRKGSPGLYSYAPVPSFFDNVKVTKND